MKRILGIVASLVLCFGICLTTSATNTVKVNKYLQEAKNKTLSVLKTDDTGSISIEKVNLADIEAKRREEKVSNYELDILMQNGLPKEKAENLTIGEYEDYLYTLPIDFEVKEYIKKFYNKTEDELVTWTKLDAENFLYDQSKSLDQGLDCGDDILQTINSQGINIEEIKTLGNLGFSLKEISELNHDEIDKLLSTVNFNREESK